LISANEYIERLKLNVNGDKVTKFFTSSNTLVAIGYQRIVIGERGPYIEFRENQINRQKIYVPDDMKWRFKNINAYYIEYRISDDAHVKIYYQKRVVSYADYKVGYIYISPFDLIANNEYVIDKLNSQED
jgi:hypothetical protein